MAGVVGTAQALIRKMTGGDMKDRLLVIMIFVLAFSACSPKPAQTEIKPTATMEPAQQATATPVPPTATPEPTPTPEPKAVALAFEGWQDKAYTYPCVDVVYLPSADENASAVIPMTDALLNAMGMQAVPVLDAACEAQFTYTLHFEGKGKTIFYPSGKNCAWFTNAELVGDLVFMAPPGGDGFWAPVISTYDEPGNKGDDVGETDCKMDMQTMVVSLLPGVVIKGFTEIYGEQALEAAKTVPELKAAAEAAQ
jgi:hypothetical protein